MANHDQVDKMIDSSPEDLCDEPLEIITHKNAVVLVGPDGVALALTVAAAKASIERLQQAVGELGG